MPPGGNNCCMPDCKNYYQKTKDKIPRVSYMSFPSKEEHPEWRGRLVAAVSRGDSKFNADKHKICTDHFDQKCLLFHGKGFKLVTDSMPTLNMPKKSITTDPIPPRKAPFPRPAPEIPIKVAYLKFAELVADSHKQASNWVVLRAAEDYLAIGQVNTDSDVIIKAVFNETFSPIVTRLGAVVRRHYDVEISGLKSFLKGLEDTNWCEGSEPRAPTCPVAVEGPGLCSFCAKKNSEKEEKAKKTVSSHTPLSTASKPALIQELKTVRQRLKEQEARLIKIQQRLETETVSIKNDVKEGLEQVIESNNITDPFYKLFWEEQKKAASRDPRRMRWHPMMVRFAIYLHFQSTRAYKALQSSGVLHLPNESTLRDYTSYFKPKEGFQMHTFQELQRKTDSLPDHERYVVLLHDEMSIRGDLVYDRRGGEIVGFLNPEAWDLKDGSDTTLASHVLVFMAIGINNNLKMSLGYFATRNATSDFLFPLLWEAVGYLEQIGLKVISSTSDKASPNQRLIRLHGDGSIVHETVNIYADEHRPFFFISDPPHLIKTLRNNLESSRGRGTRYMWNNDQHLLWDHIVRIYEDDLAHLRMSKLRNEHVYLTPSSRMSVHLAAQVLSKSISVILQRYGPEVTETTKFVEMCDRLFDCLNTRSFWEGTNELKDDMKPYKSPNDSRFELLQSIEDYFTTWKENVQRREGFSKSEKEKMFLSKQTYEGVLTTVRGFTGAAKYLLSHGVPYVFSKVFCQDPIEEHFGRHRGLGQRSRNPSVYEFGHQDNKLRMQRSLAFVFQPKGNVAGGQGERKKPRIQVDEEPLPKIKRK